MQEVQEIEEIDYNKLRESAHRAVEYSKTKEFSEKLTRKLDLLNDEYERDLKAVITTIEEMQKPFTL